jgi:hypothetical protein
VFPPPPVQVIVNELFVFSAPVLWEPDVPRVPLQAPDAVQLVALTEVQLNVALLPLVTLLAEAVSVTVGAGGARSMLSP